MIAFGLGRYRVPVAGGDKLIMYEFKILIHGRTWI